jgi:hypothetical protein
VPLPREVPGWLLLFSSFLFLPYVPCLGERIIKTPPPFGGGEKPGMVAVIMAKRLSV